MTSRRALLVALLVAPGLSPVATTQDPITSTLLQDLNQSGTGTPRSSFPVGVTRTAASSWISADVPGLGRELWKTDGTTAGTTLVDDLGTGTARSFRSALALADGTLVVAASTAALGTEPYAQLPGATGLTLLRDILPGGSSDPHAFVAWGNEIWFVADDGTPHMKLWRTDGTPTGTTLAETVSLAAWTPALSPQVAMHVAAGKLWIRTAGSPANLLVKDSPGHATRLVADGGFRVKATGLWAEQRGGLVFVRDDASRGQEPAWTDGTTTRWLADIGQGTASSNPTLIAAEAQRLWFSAYGSVAGHELWTTDGTAAGTRLVADVAAAGSNGIPRTPAGVTAFGGLVFLASDGRSGYEPWFTDGTAAGTRQLADLAMGNSSSSPDAFRLHDGAVWFRASTPATGRELFRTDGTAAGTGLAADIVPGPADSDARPIQSLPNGLLLAADDGNTGMEPWRVPTGPNARPELLANLANDGSNDGSNIQFASRFHERLLFHQWNANRTEYRMWSTDGTRGGTQVIRSAPTVHPITVSGYQAHTPCGLVFVAGPVVPATGISIWRPELWISDGTPNGTQRLASPYPTDDVPPLFGLANGKVYFKVRNRRLNDVYWETDGTTLGTAPSPGLAAFADLEIRTTFADGRLMFGSRRTSSAGSEPWVSDGTAAGTRLLVDTVPGPNSGGVRDEEPWRQGIAFSNGALWFSDGTTAGTSIVQNFTAGTQWLPDQLTATRDRLFFVTRHRSGGAPQLWSTDGTAAGTTPLQVFFQGGAVATIHQLTAAGDVVYFLAGPLPNSGVSPSLYRSDGTTAGTIELLASGSGSTDFANTPFLVAPGEGRAILFVGRDPRYGDELWTSDGTVAGTRPLADSLPGPGDGVQWSFAHSAPEAIGDQVLFTADDGSTGIELHAVPLTAMRDGWRARRLGRGCGARFELVDGAARAGATVDLEVATESAGAPFPGGLLFGAAPAFASPPADCELHLAAPVAVGAFRTDSGGRFRLRLAVPNDPALVGAQLYLQAALAVPGGPLAGAETTPALEIVIGR